MKLFGRTFVFLISFTLLAGNTANAAMLCFMADADQPNAVMQMDHGEVDTPCHETADNERQDLAGCEGCDCQHCVKMNAPPPRHSAQDMAASGVTVFAIQGLYSRQPEGVFQPPKYIS